MRNLDYAFLAHSSERSMHSQTIEDREAEAFDQWEEFIRHALDNNHSGLDMDALANRQAHIPFAKAFIPFTALFRDEIGLYLKEKPFTLSSTAYTNLITGLLRDYVEACGLTLYCTIQDEIPNRTMDDYNAWLDNFYKNRWPTFTTEYSVLGMILKQRYDQYFHHCREVFDRLEKDTLLIQETFGIKIESISSLEFRLADRHKHGRNVCMIEINGSLKIIYKPKSLKNEAWMQNLLKSNPGFKESGIGQYTVLDQKEYGWSEFVEADSQIEHSTTKIIESYSSLLALLYLINASDMHTENAMICGNTFYPVDVETIFNPPIAVPDNKFSWRDFSIFYTGMLFDDLDLHLSKPDVNSNYYNNESKQTMYRVVVDKDSGVSLRMQTPAKKEDKEEKTYRPSRLDEKEWRIFAEKTEEKILQYKDYLLQDDVFKNDILFCRHVPRNTAFYARIQQVLYHPRKLKNFQDWEDYIAQLIDTIDPDPKRSHKDQIKFVNSEMTQLKRGDIPHFEYNTGARALYADNTVIIDDYFEETAKDAIRKKLQEITREDAAEIKNLLMAKYVTWNQKPGDYKNPYSQDKIKNQIEVPTDHGLNIVENITQTILSSANITKGQPARWLSHDGDVSGIKAFHSAGNPTFYNGYWGIIAFLVTAEQYLPDRDTSSIKKFIDREIQIWLSGKQQKPFFANSGLSGLAGHIKSLWIIDTLRHQSTPIMFSKFYGDGEDIYKALEKEFDAKEFIDIDYIGGKVGLALTLHQIPYDIIDKNRLAGLLDRYHNDILIHWDNYISLRDKALVGYAHGVSALAHHLGNCLLPGSAADQKLARKLLHKVWQYDGSCRMAGTNQWTDNRFITDEPLNRSWCHGLPGVGISRLGLLPIQEYCGHAKADLAFILQTLRCESHTHGSHHLCCGDCGEIDFLIETSKIDEYKEVSEQLLALRTHSLLEDIGNGQLFYGTAGTIKSSLAPDLFQGAAGIGYTLLRIQNRDLPVVY